jgi:hypothetical protein
MKLELGKEATKQAKKNPTLGKLLLNLREKIATQTEQQLRDGAGIHLEPIKSAPGLSSIRVNQGIRAVCTVEGDTLWVLSVQGDHDRAYGQGGKKGSIFRFLSRFLKAAEYDYSTFQIVYTGKDRDEVQKFIDSIDLSDVYKDEDIKGKETKVHTTILYGIKDKTPDSLKIAENLPQSVQWTGLSKFVPEDQPYEVLIIKAEKSPELQSLFNYLNETYPDNANSFPDYVPHTTIAYVKKGTADKYIEAYPKKFKQEVTDYVFEFEFNGKIWRYEK